MRKNKTHARKTLLLFFALIASYNISLASQDELAFSSNNPSQYQRGDTLYMCNGATSLTCSVPYTGGIVTIESTSFLINDVPLNNSAYTATTTGYIYNGQIQNGNTYTTITTLHFNAGQFNPDTTIIDTSSIYICAFDASSSSISYPTYPADTIYSCYDDSVSLSAVGNSTGNGSWYWFQPFSVGSNPCYMGNGCTFSSTAGNIILGYQFSEMPVQLQSVCLVDTVFIKPIGIPYHLQQICLVTVDTATGYNEIIFEPTHGQNIAEYKIYKLNDVTSQYDSIGVVAYDSLGIFIDVNSNSAQQSASYAISIVDSTCGIESGMSSAHRTLHLSSNVGTSGESNLQWNAYSGFSYSTFEIYRSNNGGVFSQIGNTANSVTSYTDLTPPSGTNRYYIAVEKQPACDPSRSIASTISNVSNPAEASGVNDISKDNVSIYPNPFTDKLTITPNISYQLFDMLGREVDKNNLSKLPVGTYILKTERGATRVIKN